MDGASQRYVGIDNLVAGADVARWIAAQGLNEVGLIHASLTSSATAERVVGFRATLKESGIAMPRQRIQTVAGAEHLEIGYHSMQALMAQSKPVQLVFCTSDLIAYGAHRYAREAGFQIGKDLTLIGLDDSPMNTWVAPWLNAVRLPYSAYGDAIVRSLVDISNKSNILPHELIIRT